MVGIRYGYRTGGYKTTYQFKWGGREPKPPKEWTDAYPTARFEVVNRENYLGFVT
jgi:hypothetical protein